MPDDTLRMLSEFIQRDVGSVLRAKRVQRGVSLRALAKLVGISASAMSQIETGRSRPSVGTLYAVTNELEIPLHELFGAPGNNNGKQPWRPDPPQSSPPESPLRGRPLTAGDGPVQRAATRQAIELATGVQWERLTAATDPGIDFLIVHYGAGSASSPDRLLMRHSGHEYGLLLSGQMRVTIGFEQFDLSPGDSISFDSSCPHLLENLGDEPAEAVWIVIGRGGDNRNAPLRKGRGD